MDPLAHGWKCCRRPGSWSEKAQRLAQELDEKALAFGREGMSQRREMIEFQWKLSLKRSAFWWLGKVKARTLELVQSLREAIEVDAPQRTG